MPQYIKWAFEQPERSCGGNYDAYVVDGILDPDTGASLLADGHHVPFAASNRFAAGTGEFCQALPLGEFEIPHPNALPNGDQDWMKAWDDLQDLSTLFLCNPVAQRFFYSRVEYMINQLKDHPGIMAWQLANEPRSFRGWDAIFRLWVERTAQFIRDIDKNHLISIGSEGELYMWGNYANSDYRAFHDLPNIDYLTFHVWPENWGWYDPSLPIDSTGDGSLNNAITRSAEFVAVHMAHARALNKPVVVEEFGLARDDKSSPVNSSVNKRNAYYEWMFLRVVVEAELMGLNFWAWAGAGRPDPGENHNWRLGDEYIGDPPHEEQGWYSVFSTDVTTLDLVDEYASRVALATAVDGDFVTRVGSDLMHRGEVFRFAGANNFYMMYSSKYRVDRVLETAAENHFRVVRTWGFIDIGSEDGTGSTHGKPSGVYFHYWDGDKPAYNDGQNGLARLDYIIAKAGEQGIKLVVALTNNWQEFGGMDQYVRWRGGQYHDEFYTDDTIKGWYKDWVSHVLNRVNTYTGIAYKDDPTIAMWELANEPRCKGSGLYATSATCSTQTLVAWAKEMSAFVKSIDSNHLVSMGDEGFYCKEPGSWNWLRNCSEGVDSLALAAIDTLDVMSVHAYPDHWGTDVSWTTDWIQEHIQDARSLGKPMYLGEYGLHDDELRISAYRTWTDTILADQGSGSMFWVLVAEQEDGTIHGSGWPFAMSCPSPACAVLRDHAVAISGL